MDNFSFTRDLILVLGTAFLGGFIAKKLRQPLLTGYILGGVIVGAIVSRFFQPSENLVSLAEIGVVFLMFTLGLEFSWSKFKHISRNIVLATISQILFIIIFCCLIFPRFGFDFYTSLFLGCCLSLSSTAVVVKILSDRGELETLSGEISLGWLLLQDLAVLPMIIILPVLSTDFISTKILLSLTTFIQAVVKAIILLVIIFFLGKRLVPIVTDKILKTHSRELLLLWVVAFCLIMSFTMASLGFSFAMGAFLAGFLISEVGISASVFAEMRPLRDIFAVIFFVTLGFLVNPLFLLNHSITIILISLLIILLKFFIVFVLILYLGYHTKTAFLTGFSITSVGEFAFVLAQMGLSKGIISTDVNLIIISVTLFTLVVSPWMISIAPIAYRKLKSASLNWQTLAKFFNKFDKQPIKEELPFENHVVICGFGRVGKYIGRALEMAKINFVVVDYNHQIIKQLQDKGLNVVYGDPAEIDVLDYAQVDKARAIIIAIPDRQTQEMVITNAQSLRPGIKIICRSHHEEDHAKLKALQVDTIIQPEFEAALSIVNKILHEYGLYSEEIDGKIKRLKIEHGM
ncbi:MAG: cation:proton antiporter [Candidatus Gottesmanbacteria bacterium]